MWSHTCSFGDDLIEKRCKNMCIADLIDVRCDSLTCLSAQSENAEV